MVSTKSTYYPTTYLPQLSLQLYPVLVQATAVNEQDMCARHGVAPREYLPYLQTTLPSCGGAWASGTAAAGAGAVRARVPPERAAAGLLDDSAHVPDDVQVTICTVPGAVLLLLQSLVPLVPLLPLVPWLPPSALSATVVD